MNFGMMWGYPELSPIGDSKIRSLVPVPPCGENSSVTLRYYRHYRVLIELITIALSSTSTPQGAPEHRDLLGGTH